MTSTTKRLLACGAVGGPLFATVGLAQALTRPGFDLSKQALSLLSLGSAGWIQIANFLVSGALALAFAKGARRALRDAPGGRWLPRLLSVYGAGLIVGGIFHPDAGDGFPPGTASGQSVVRTWHGALHMTAGTLAFLALMASCFVVARTFARGGRAALARTSRGVGIGFLVCLMASAAPGGSLILFVGVTAAMIWMAVVARQLATEPAVAGHDRRAAGAPGLRSTAPVSR